MKLAAFGLILRGCFRAVVVAQVVAHRTTDREIPSWIPTGSWFFSFSSLSYLSGFQLSIKNGGLAVQLEAKQA